MKRIPKIHYITLKKWMSRHIPFQKGNLDEYRISIRHGLDVYIISNPSASGISPEKFRELEEKLKYAEIQNLPIQISYIKRYGKKFVENIEQDLPF